MQDKVPPKLELTALVSSGITIVTSICYLILSIIALIYRYDCDTAAPESTDNAQFTWHMVYRVYIQNEDCVNLVNNQLTQSYTVFLLITLTLCASVCTLVTGSVLTAGVKNNNMTKYINVMVFAYIASCVGSLAVDVTLATHLGIDHSYLTQQLRDNTTEYNFVVDSLRHGVFVLMSVVLKGYAILGLNVVLISMLIVYTYEYHTSSGEQHSIHKEGALNAFDQPRRMNDHWGKPDPMSPYASSYARGQSNHAYLHEDHLPSHHTRSDYYATPSQSFNRSNSWQHQPSNSHSSRPFSYMDEARRCSPVAVKPPVSPAWSQPPPVPAPDYSPHTPRRLKSALKPAGYM